MNYTIYIMLLVSILLGLYSDLPINSVSSKTNPKTSLAGQPLSLVFKNQNSNDLKIALHSSIGSTIILADRTNIFNIPDHFSIKKGQLKWILLDHNKQIKNGIIDIKESKAKKVIIETYVGPPSIVCGGKDFTMLVCIPTDIHDNPIADNNTITTKYQTNNQIRNTTQKTQNLIGWKKIFSSNKTGRLLISSEIKQSYSNEISIDMLPNNPISFKVLTKAQHKFADGNQALSIFTNKIMDQYGNCITDGTIVTFSIKDSNNSILEATGSTINGIAKAKILHPNSKTLWEIQAHIPYIASSNKTQIRFKENKTDFKVTFKNRSVTVYSIIGFMNQVVNNGNQISLEIFKNKKLLKKLKKESSHGAGHFSLSNSEFEKGIYQIKISVNEKSKTYTQTLN